MSEYSNLPAIETGFQLHAALAVAGFYGTISKFHSDVKIVEDGPYHYHSSIAGEKVVMKSMDGEVVVVVEQDTTMWRICAKRPEILAQALELFQSTVAKLREEEVAA